MNFRDTLAIQTNDEPAKKPKIKKSAGKYFNSLEYELITSLIQQQYLKNGNIDFNLLLSVPVKDRIPGLMEEYGLKRMHQLLLMIVKAFCFTLPLPKTKKLSETKMSVCACDLIIAAHEDYLSLEEVILFFEQAKKGQYGKIKSLLHHQQIMDMLEQYRKERHAAYVVIKEKQHEQLKTVGPTERTSSEPTSIGELMKRAAVIDMNKRMSG